MPIYKTIFFVHFMPFCLFLVIIAFYFLYILCLMNISSYLCLFYPWFFLVFSWFVSIYPCTVYILVFSLPAYILRVSPHPLSPAVPPTPLHCLLLFCLAEPAVCTLSSFIGMLLWCGGVGGVRDRHGGGRGGCGTCLCTRESLTHTGNNGWFFVEQFI